VSYLQFDYGIQVFEILKIISSALPLIHFHLNKLPKIMLQKILSKCKKIEGKIQYN
jgi:hypothetical protein